MGVQSKKKLKLLFICSDKFPPYRVDVSALFGKKLAERGHQTDLLIQSDETMNQSYQTKWLGGTAWVGRTDNGTSGLRRFRKHLYGFFHDFKAFRLVKQNKYNMILVRDKFVFALFAIVASGIFKIPFIFWLSYPFPENDLYKAKEGIGKYPFIYWIRGHFFKLILYRIIMRFSNHNFVQTEQMLKEIASHNIPKKNMTAVPMAVSLDSIPFFGYASREKVINRKKTVLYLGSLGKTRKMDFLIRVFDVVFRRQSKAKLILVGGGVYPSDEQMLLDLAKRLGIGEEVIITGFIPQEKAWQYVKDADVCVSPIFPSPILNLGSPTKLLEYMAMGKAAVANDHPEQHLVISESKAGICVPYEEEAFAGAIIYLLSHPKEAKAMGLRGREYVRKHRSYEDTADVVERKLLSLCYSHGLGMLSVL